MAIKTSHPSDISARKTHKGIDDLRYEREQKQKRAPKQKLPAILPDGPCCARCANWHPPEGGEPFGLCREAVVLDSFLPERRIVMTRDEAQRTGELNWQYLPTRGFMAGCSLYKEAA